MSEEIKKYIVFWTWNFADTDKGIDLYYKMNELKEADLKEEDMSRRIYPTSHGSSHGDTSPDWFTIFEATEKQLNNWLKHYGEVLQVKKIMPIMGADEFIKKWVNEEITWKYWYRR